MTAILQIVDGLGGATVMDLNATAGGQGVMAGVGLALYEQQLASDNPLQWSPLMGQAALGNRRATIPFRLFGSSADDAGAKVALLAQLTRGPWWLRVRRSDATTDSWLQCFPGVPLVESKITASSISHIAVGTITCETAPFALGQRVDGSSDIKQDPSASAFTMDINNVPGDTPTPLLLRFHDATVFDRAMSMHISVRRRQTPSALSAAAIVTQGQDPGNDYQPGPGVTLGPLPEGTISTELSGNNGARASFPGGYQSGNASTIVFSAPSVSGVNVPGVYRMLLRIRRAQPEDSYTFRAFTSGTSIVPDEIFVPGGTQQNRVLDLGLVQWPAGMPAGVVAPVFGPSGASATQVALQFWKNSDGNGLIDFDWLAWVPADEGSGVLSTESQLRTPGTQWLNVDSYQGQAVVTDANPTGSHRVVGHPYTGIRPNPLWDSGEICVRPGSNRLFVVGGMSSLSSWSKTQTVATAYSYWPRFTWLR